MPSESTAANQHPLELFNQLDQEEQLFLQIIALLDSDTPREELFRIVKALFQALGHNYNWNTSKAAAQQQKLLQLTLIDEQNRCHP